jgi:phosphopantothenoylcysteine decarboxylase/phosphopantothenate--cysteine ligase
VLVTAGPTYEPIDPVRFLGNRSSGKQGFAIAAALAGLGARVSLVSGPVGLADPAGVSTIRVQTADEMLAACLAALPADAAVFAAAVADWRLAGVAEHKLRKADGAPALDLVPNPDMLATIAAAGPARPKLVVGFAAETADLAFHAAQKRRRKNADWIVANDVRPETGIMGGADNCVTLFHADGEESFPSMPKTQVAALLATRIAAFLQQDQP